MRSIPSRSARRSVGVAALATLVLSGCATTVDGSGQGVPTSSATPSVDFPSSATTTPTPEPSTTPIPTPSPTQSVAPDITDVKYTVPNGFVRNADYHEVIPLETSFQAKYLIPSGVTPGLDVISVVLYRLPAPHLVDTRARQVARIRAYNRKRSVTIKRKLADTTVGGLPAFDESVVQPGGYRYGAWFVFGGAHLVQISCQVDTHVDVVAAGCQSLIDSVVFT